MEARVIAENKFVELERKLNTFFTDNKNIKIKYILSNDVTLGKASVIIIFER